MDRINPSSDQGGFGTLLREARRLRRLSQLELALRAQVSQRHLSFLESGRAQPSREMVIALAQVLDLPLRERNRLLHTAGFAGLYPQRRLETADMQPVRQALELLLRHQEPFPAVAVDRAWNLFMSNSAMQGLLAMLGDVDALWRRVCGEGPRNVFKLIFHPQGLRPLVVNLDEIAPPLLARTAREALEHPEVQAVLDEVLRYPDLPLKLRHIDLDASRLPVLPLHLRLGELNLRLFTMLSSFGTPQDVTADELRVESFFPLDAESETLLRRLAG
ncbi:DNA-binding transcriptional regulator, XRE-family HTH domain [Solimonas aquatica]|uniref:DNA-binding transcriptional regulator, XRE-family HTH domain n=1 Tax=Solimonas aquatica TaxID=489703 RepID=A0A1H9ETG5_9GAMM|nr:helix-turn-helix domain-containing protein [Solimonas aquatica]SEQ28533.1 DNA-binding transcriptional regulator, XRE-family HTH domain [Solimonas aquatica]